MARGELSHLRDLPSGREILSEIASLKTISEVQGLRKELGGASGTEDLAQKRKDLKVS